MMPDREKTRPYLLEQVKQAEIEVKTADLASRSIGPLLLEKALAGLAVAGTLLAVADAEWAREAASVTEVAPGAAREPRIPHGPVELHTSKPI